jgi:hypothetical protein
VFALTFFVTFFCQEKKVSGKNFTPPASDTAPAINKVYGNKIYFTAKAPDTAEVFFSIPSRNVPGVLFGDGSGTGKVVFKPLSFFKTGIGGIDTAFAVDDTTTRYCKGDTCWDISLHIKQSLQITGSSDVNTFRAFTDQTIDSITGPESGSSTWIPLYNGSPLLAGKGVFLVIRSNIPATRGIDYAFNTSSGAINLTQPDNGDEIYQVLYNSVPSSISSGDTSAAVIDTSTYTTQWGMIYLGTDLNATGKFDLLTSSFKCKYLRTSIKMDTWDGRDGLMDKVAQSGGDSVKVILTIDWKTVGKTPTGDKAPNRFLQPSEYSTYTTKLNQILTKYHDIIKIVVIENEPTTKHFYFGSVLDYIDELALAIPIVHSYPSLLVADGCVHTGYVQSIMSGNLSNVNTRQVDTIIAHYPSLDLDFTNFHTSGAGTSYNVNLKAICDYLRAHNGGKPIISNEWHVESVYASLMQSIVSKMKEANVVYSVCLDPGAQGGSDIPLHVIGTITLTPTGQAFYNAIHP